MRSLQCFAVLCTTCVLLPGQSAYFNRAVPLSVESVDMSGPRSIATGDFNGDGIPDLVTGNVEAITILLGQGNGEFRVRQSLPLRGQAEAVVVADFNQDGQLDIATANGLGGTISIFAGVGDGSFRTPLTIAIGAAGANVVSLAAADFNRDGLPDLAIAIASEGMIVVLGNGKLGFRQSAGMHAAQTGAITTQIALADLNGDGQIDVAVGHQRASFVSMFLGRGDGTFGDEQAYEVCPDPGAMLAQQPDAAGATGVIVGSLSGGGVWLVRPAETPVRIAKGGVRALAFGDWNGDGIPDLAGLTLEANSMWVAAAKADGSFADPVDYFTGNMPNALAVGDWDADGIADLAVANSMSGSVTVLMGRSAGKMAAAPVIGSFRPTRLVVTNPGAGGELAIAALSTELEEVRLIAVGPDGGTPFVRRYGVGQTPVHLVPGDFDGDGLADLIVTNSRSNDLSFLRGRDDLGFDPEVRTPLRSGQGTMLEVAAGDFNGDGLADLAGIFPASDVVAILPGRGDGSFDLPVIVASQARAMSLAAGDFNADGKLDLAVSQYQGGVSFYLGSNELTFRGTASNSLSRTIGVLHAADLNNDTVAELIGVDTGGTGLMTYAFSTPAARFLGNSSPGLFPGAMVLGDFNRDGKLDVALASGSSNNVSVAIGNGDGTFQSARAFPTEGNVLALVAADLNGDGRPDLIAGTTRGISILWNDSAPPPPPVPTVPQPVAPTSGAAIVQNDPSSGCPADPVRGSGYMIRFQWAASVPAASVAAYEISLSRNGVENTVGNPPGPSFTAFDLHNCAFIIDANLEGWQWKVRAIGLGGLNSDWSPAVTFRFQPCRLADGRPCGAPAPPPANGGTISTSNMASRRARHSATLLLNNKVLVAGGDNYDTGVVHEQASAELYDPATNSWTATGAPRVARSGHRATLLADGRVLLSGGRIFQRPPAQPISLADAEVYNPVTGQFTTVANMTVARSGHTATLLPDGRVLIAGGMNSGSTAEIFNPATNAFTYTGKLSFSRSDHTATLLPNGLVLIVGGGTTLGVPAELFDPVRGQFNIAATPLFWGLWHTATALPGNQVLLAGGQSESGMTALTQIYDIGSGKFQLGTSLTSPRYFHQATLVANGSVLVTGGIGTGGVMGAMVDLYVPASRQVMSLPPLLFERSEHTATLLPDGTVLLAGGTQGSTQGVWWTNTAERYSPPR